jgi:hypothetical protein
MVQEKHENTWKIALLKSFGSKAVKRKDFYSASAFYTKVWYILCSTFKKALSAKRAERLSLEELLLKQA